MNSVKILSIPNTELHNIWPFVKAGLEDIKERWPVEWLAEDVYAALCTVNAELFIVQCGDRRIAYFVAYKHLRPYNYLPEYFIWVFWSLSIMEREPEDEKARDEIIKFIKARAKQLNCVEAACMSPRRGLEKMGFVPWMTTYRMPL